jgi:hypothetical protein
MRLTVPHWFNFGDDRALVGDDLVRPEAWDALRTGTSGPFALPATRAEWERAADERGDIRDNTTALSAFLDERGVGRLASYGVGGATVELWLHRLRPERELVLTDYAPATVERLAELFPEAQVGRHDILTDPPLEADLHLFHRIDSELRDRQWRAVFARFEALPVLVVATEVASLRRIALELRGWWVTRRTTTRAGWLRTAGAFEALWRPTHRSTRLRFGALDAWLLEPR